MEKIYMIPVNDAYNGTEECPFCFLKNKSENDYLEYYLGPSLMEPDTRKITNNCLKADLLTTSQSLTISRTG